MWLGWENLGNHKFSCVTLKVIDFHFDIFQIFLQFFERKSAEHKLKV